MAYNAGQALLQVVPSFKGVADAIDAEAAKWGVSAGGSFAGGFNETVKSETKNAPLGPSDEESGQKGSSSGGKFADAFKARVEAALKSLPNVDIGANDAEAQAKIDEIRTRLETLRDSHIGIDLTDAEALGAVEILKGELDELGAKSPNIRVKVDAAGASAELAAIGAQADAAGSGLGTLGSDAGASAGDISAMVPALAALATALIPIGALAAGALSAIPAILGGAVSGLGALKLGLGGVLTAFSDYGKQQTALGKAAAGGGGSGGSGGNTASTAISNAAAIRNAANSVRTAQESLANAQVAAANSVHQANQQLASSENALADAEFNEQQAQINLTDARQAAQDQLDNYKNSLADGLLGIQQAQLDITAAAANVKGTGPGTGATAQQEAQAQLSYQQALQRLTDLQTQQGQLQTASDAATAAGVDGSQQVVTAQHQQVDAVNAVATAQQSVTDNQAALAQAQVDAVQKVNDAQINLTNALQNQSDALAQIAASAAGSGGGGGGGGAAGAVNTFAAAMAKLSPQGRDFVNFLIGVKTQFDGLSNQVQGALLPGLQAGLTAMEPLFKPLAGFILDAATGIATFVTNLGTFLGSKAGVADFNAIFKAGAGFMRDLGGAVLSLAPAFGTIGAQAAPIVNAIGTGIGNLAKSFAGWVAGGGFQKFVDWLAANGPGIVSDISEFAKGFGKLIVALAPTGKLVLDLIGHIAQFVGSITDVIKWILFLCSGPLRVLSFALGEITKGVDYLSSHWKQIWSDIKQWADDGYQHVKSAVFDPLVNFFTQTIPQTFDSVVGFFTALPGRIVTGLGDFVTTIFGGLEAIGTWLETNVWSPLSSWFVGIPDRVASAIGDFFTKAFAILLTVASWLNSNVLQPVVGFFTNLPGQMANALGSDLSKVFGFLSGAWNWIKTNVYDPIVRGFGSLLGDIGSAISGGLNDVGSVFTTIGKDIVNGIIDGINTIINTIDSALDGLGLFGVHPFSGKVIPDIPSLRAQGGPVDANTPYIVGEQGPEIMVPNTSGYIVPNHALSGANNLSPATSTTGPVQHVDTQIIQSQADAVAMSQQLSFLRRGRML